MFLSGVVPTVDVNAAYLAPPSPQSVTDISQQPLGFTVKLPSFEQPKLSQGEIAAITGAVMLALWSMRGRR